MPNVYIIAGPNGAGKTTFARKFLPEYVNCKNFVNTDLIARGLSPFHIGRNSLIKAGRIVLSQIEEFATKKFDFSFETTLAGKTYIKFLKDIKKEGYKIHIFFLWIPNVRLALIRIKNRVLEGGHNVPKHDVIRRFKRSTINFFQFYEKLADSWMIFDNSELTPRLIARKEKDKIIVEDKKLYKRLRRIR